MHHSFTATATPPAGVSDGLQALHPGTWQVHEPASAAACWRAELPVSDTDPLAFLRRLTTAGAWLTARHTYWADRAHTLQSAGVGSAAVVAGERGASFAEVCAAVRRLIGCPEQRLFGGFAFAAGAGAGAEDGAGVVGTVEGRRREPLWDPFGAYRFILPRIELVRTAAGTRLACNFRDDERDRLGRVLGDLTRWCWPALQADAPPVTDVRLTPVSPLIQVPELPRWRQLVEQMLCRFDHGSGARRDGTVAHGSNGTGTAGPTGPASAAGTARLEKVVLARRTTFHYNAAVCAVALLQRLRLVNPEAFHFVVQPAPGISFFGATPERLLRLAGDTVETEAMAGTRPRGASADADARLERELLASDKELLEHRFVHTSIDQSLRRLCTSVTTQDTVGVRKLAHVQHLHTTFTGTLRRGVGVAAVLEHLHPTPAVGGYPKRGAAELIAATEAFHRGWYAGPVGWLGAESAEFAVGIRSGVAHGDTLHLYAGDGIVRGSVADAEWAEMEQKIRQILDVV